MKANASRNIAAWLLILSSIASGHQQSEDKTARQTRLLLEACFKQAEEVDYLTSKVAALTKLDAQGKELVAALDAQVAALEKTIAALKAANAAGDKIETISDKELKSLQASLDGAKKQIEKWKGRAGFWKRVAGFGVTAAIAIGIGIGFALGNK